MEQEMNEFVKLSWTKLHLEKLIGVSIANVIGNTVWALVIDIPAMIGVSLIFLFLLVENIIKYRRVVKKMQDLLES